MSHNETFPFYCANGGGKWFTCDSGTRFLGCCKRNPCQTGCAPEDRLPGYFNSSYYGTFKDQLCGVDDGLYYTCAASGFFGCCKSNPCNNMVSSGRCPYADLGSIVLSTDPEQVEYWTPENWNQNLNVGSYHQQLQEVAMTNEPDADSDILQNPFPLSITLALALIGLVTLSSFAMLVLALISHKRHRKGDMGLPSSAAERVPLTHTSPQLASSRTSPNVPPTYLHGSPVPAIQLTPPLPSGTWSSDPLQTKVPKFRASRTSSVFIKAIDSTHQRPHKWAHVLIFVTCLVLTVVTTFLAVLWFVKSSALWQYIMSRNYITRFIATSTVIVRTMVDIQACIAATMLAAIFLESRSGVALADSVAISIMRYDTTPLTLALPVMRGFAHQKRQFGYNMLLVLLLCLVFTTILLQLSSTALLMDLAIGALPGLIRTRQLPIDFSYTCMSDSCNQVYLNQIPRISSWGMGPPAFPAFAEMKAPPEAATPGVADTGMLLRAFPPYIDPSTRQSVREYTGKAFIMDSRVSCQAPVIDDLVWHDAAYSNFTGKISSRISAPMVGEIVPTGFSCTYGNVNHLSLCQISNNPFEAYTGSLDSQFRNNTVQNKTYEYDERPAHYGTAFLVVKVLNATEMQTSGSKISYDGITEYIYENEWLDLKKTTSESFAALSLSLCFAPWDAARLPATFSSESNRSEPLTTWQPPQVIECGGSFDMSQVLHQLGVGGSANASFAERGILDLTLPSFEVVDPDDIRPRSQRPFIQTDASEVGLSFGGANVPLASNWTIFLSGNILPSILTNFSYTPQNVFAADPAIANLFVAALGQSNVAHAMASVITILSATSYYNQVPALDYATNVDEIFFEPVLIPLSTFGFTAFVYVLAAHVVVVAIVVALFKMKTKLSLVGESWSAVAPLLTATSNSNISMDVEDEKAGEDIKEMLASASGLVDDDVWRELKRRGAGKTAVRLEEGDAAEGDRNGIKFRVVE